MVVEKPVALTVEHEYWCPMAIRNYFYYLKLDLEKLDTFFACCLADAPSSDTQAFIYFPINIKEIIEEFDFEDFNEYYEQEDNTLANGIVETAKLLYDMFGQDVMLVRTTNC